MTLMCILFALMMIPVIIGMACIAACLNDMNKQIEHVYEALDEIRYWMEPRRGESDE